MSTRAAAHPRWPQRLAVWVLSIGAAGMLAGCAQAPRHLAPDAQWRSGPALADAPAMRPFFSGRIAVKVDALQGDEGSQFSSGAFELGGDEHNGQLRLLSPLGQVLAQANWAAAGEVALRTGQETRHFASLATMSRQLLGEDIPLAALMAWMAGRTWAGAPHQTLDTAQRFEQLGWTVDASALSGSGRLMAERLGPPAVVVRVRLDPAHLPALLAPP